MLRQSCFPVVLFSLLLSGSFLSAQSVSQRLALVVGIREYPASDKLTPLAFTESDADGIASTLRRSGFEVTLMTQTAAEGQSNRRFAPHAALIRKQFQDLVATPFLTKQDCVMIVLEGHGIQLPARDDAEKLTFYFCPADALIDELKFSDDVEKSHNLIAVQELYETLKTSGAGVKLLVVDACRNDPNKPDVFRSPNSLTRPPLPTPPGGTAVMLSCSANQRAAEDPDLKHGVFSYFLIEGLGGKADLDGDAEIDLTELQRYVGTRTFTHVRQKYSTRQMPEFQGEITGWAPLLTVPRSELTEGKKAGDLWEGNSLGMKFRWCPPGTFLMGSPENEKDRGNDEAQVRVTLTEGYWLGQYEVTQREWQQVMETTPWNEGYEVKEVPNHPAVFISWEAAAEFCRQWTDREREAERLPPGWQYVLPTQAQWEYACRAGSKTRFYYGEDPEAAKLGDYAWFKGNSMDIGEQYAHAIGQKKSNAWNLHDMHGNVWEWCRDWYAEKLPGGENPLVTVDSGYRVGHGGSYGHTAGECRAAKHFLAAPEGNDANLGFRVALLRQK